MPVILVVNFNLYILIYIYRLYTYIHIYKYIYIDINNFLSRKDMGTSIKTVVFWHPRICNPLDRSSAIYLNGSVLSILLISVNFNLRKGLINDS